MAQRVTNHNSRKGDNGKPIKATHNEHEQSAEHIDPTKTADNMRWLYLDVPVVDGADFQDRYEQAVYEAYFSDALAARNAKAIAGRHKERVQTMAQYRQNPKACPEESLYYVGNQSDNVDPAVLQSVYEAYHAWHKETFPGVMVLSAYMHVDEATPHIHERKVWTAHKDGMLIVNQEQSLREMGIERPDTTKPTSRHNNAKMSYTAMCREKLIELARAQGLDITDKPREPGKSGKKLLQYQCDAMQIAADAATRDAEQARIIMDAANLRAMHAEEEAEAAAQAAADAAADKAAALSDKAAAEQSAVEYRQAAAAAQQQLKTTQDAALAYQQPPKKPLETRSAYEERSAIAAQAAAVVQRTKQLDARQAALDARQSALERRQAAFDAEVVQHAQRMAAKPLRAAQSALEDERKAHAATQSELSATQSALNKTLDRLRAVFLAHFPPVVRRMQHNSHDWLRQNLRKGVQDYDLSRRLGHSAEAQAEPQSRPQQVPTR